MKFYKPIYANKKLMSTLKLTAKNDRIVFHLLWDVKQTLFQCISEAFSIFIFLLLFW